MLVYYYTDICSVVNYITFILIIVRNLFKDIVNSSYDWNELTETKDFIILFQLLLEWLWELKVCLS